MKQRFFRSMCLLAALTAFLSFMLTLWVMYNRLYDDLRTEVRRELTYLSTALEQGGETALTQVQDGAGDSRITWIDANGTVLYDSISTPSAMENHLNRPELQAALQSGYGEAAHTSQTLGGQTFYAAARLSDGTVLRISAAVDSVFTNVVNCIPLLLLLAAIVLILAVLLARGQTKRLVRAVEDLDLEHPLSNRTYEELSPLLLRIDRQNARILEATAALQKQKEEFSSITQHLSEGLILVNGGAEVLAINPSARTILRLPPKESYTGQHILSLSRCLDLQTAMEKSLTGHSWNTQLETNGRLYRLMANPVLADGSVKGAVLLLLDVTEQQAAEQMRREFTANVSHELKTPLTSISGFAEIIQNGLVQQADLPRFAGRIYKEAQRLIALVEDIIRLSHLDEQGDSLPREPVELLALAKEVAEQLEPLAEAAQVTLQTEGNPGTIFGVRPVLQEMLFNLCDNAIKYNRTGGSVLLSVRSQPDKVVVTVSDTGIGISPAHQSRVFERFYRVDKSHSKQTGGTGLGLSIVKHGAQCHNARLSLHSVVGEGTVIQLQFHKEE